MTRSWKFWPRFSEWVLSVPVRVKIMGIVLGVISLLAVVVIVQIRATMRATLRDELSRRGVSIARDLAGRATDLILTDNLFSVHTLVREQLESDHDIRYVLILDRSQDLIAHTFGPSFPPDLLRANAVSPGEEFRVAVLDTEEGLVWDAAAAILEGKLGTVRVGMSEHHLQAAVRDTTRFLLLVTGCASFVGVMAAYLLTFVATKPILDLVNVTEAIGAGDLQRKAVVRTRDEVGRLAAAFNAMTEALAQSRDEIEGFNRQLLRRNEELSVLNAISLTVSRSLHLQDILDGALATVLEALEVKAGWIFLQDGQEGHLALAASKGLSEAYVREEAEKDLGNCVCRQVMESGEARIFADIFACPRLSRRVLEQEGLRYHVSIPLKAKDRVLGIMNLGCGGARTFELRDLQLLSSLGHQIGIAIENASLYEEVQQKEVERRRLLDKLIGAQEDERKRIARELHDQVGQSLTALIMGLGSIEEMVPPEAEQVKSQLAEIRTLSATILEEIRRLMIDLRPALLDDLGLIPAVRSFAETHLARARVQSQVEVVGARRKLPAAVEITLFRVIQEGITNIVKHAGAQKATVELCFRESSVAASIEDDGKGFDRTQLGQDANALGLLGMRERVTLLGGTWRIESRPGRGTRVAVEIPTTIEPNRPPAPRSRVGGAEVPARLEGG